MRIDKYLKVARILKRREVGKQLALNERLFINGKAAKPSSEVNAGDEIRIVFGHRQILLKVLEVRDSASKEQAFSMYEVLEEIKEELRPASEESDDSIENKNVV
ncbi:MAG: RNA-binding S4 domain-containing protein [Erysipelotrichaceae bacterium]|nr:RNA-binding S4 domain-containing protein [Erysipelotrichaceae bacterium]